MTDLPPTRLRTAGRAVTSLLGLVVAILIGGAAATIAARWSALPAVFVGVGLVVTALTAAVTAELALRHAQTGHRRHRWSAAVATGTVALASVLWFTPLHDPALTPESGGVRYWHLPTGSTLAYQQVPATGPGLRPWPVLMLHGGPGIPDLSGDTRFWGSLAADGFTVYTYEQLGAGHSTRLTDPTGYTVGRDVADLEQIRRLLHTERVILIGHSYGAGLAVAYLAAHPDHVDRLVLSSPGPLDPVDHSADQATARLTFQQRLSAYAAALAPRALLGYTLLQVNPAAAHAYLPDAEADARNDTILTAAEPGLHCAASHPRTRISGSGFYRLQYPQSATAPPPQDLRPQLAGLPTPTLVIKGGCDYLSWSSAIDYRRSLPSASLIYLPNAGHNTYQDAPDAVLGATRAFLTDQPPPIPPYPGDTAPANYQHP